MLKPKSRTVFAHLGPPWTLLSPKAGRNIATFSFILDLTKKKMGEKKKYFFQKCYCIAAADDSFQNPAFLFIKTIGVCFIEKFPIEKKNLHCRFQHIELIETYTFDRENIK